MYEIKKIHAQSLANYLAMITAIMVFVFGLINFLFEIFGASVYTRISWQGQIISWFISVLIFYIIAWISGYLFSIIYNFLASRSRGIIIDAKEIDVSIFKEKLKDKLEDKKDKFIV